MRIFLLALLALPLFAKDLVLVSVPPMKYFVEQIAGDLVDVESIVPAGAGPHSYEPTPKQVEKIKGARIWFQTGEPFEDKIQSALRGVQMVDLCEGLALLAPTCTHCHKADPHIWMSPKLAEKFSRTMASYLEEFLPPEAIADGLARLEANLAELNREIRAKLRPCRGETILVSHPAFGYLCACYGLTQLSVEQEGREPTPRQLESLIQEVQDAGVHVALIQRQYAAKGTELIAQRLGLRTTLVNPLSENYPQMMHQVADAICG